MILSVRTDKPEAEIGLFSGKKKIDYLKWQADQELSNNLHRKIADMLEMHKLGWNDLSGVIYFEGPGSFTGLRIGASLVNTLTSELDIPASQATGESWIEESLKKIKADPNRRIVIPNYGRPPRITKPKK